MNPGGVPREEEEPPSTPVASSSWQQLPDGFLALALPDELKLSSMSAADDPAGGSPTAEGALAELPTLRLQVGSVPSAQRCGGLSPSVTTQTLKPKSVRKP